MIISLSELRAARARMTGGAYIAKGSMIVTDGRGIAMVNNTPTATTLGFAFGAEDDSTYETLTIADNNAGGIVATHNAADVLLECVQAQLELRLAIAAERAAAAECRRVWDGPSAFAERDAAEGLRLARARLESAGASLDAALAKVRP